MSNILVGAGGHSKVVYEIAEQNKFVFDCFVDPAVEKLYDLQKCYEIKSGQKFFIGIGGTAVSHLVHRHNIYQQQIANKNSSLTIVSPNAYVSTKAVVGLGTLIAHKAVVQVSARIGENVIINTGVIIEHDVVIEDGAHIAPGAIILGGAIIGAMSMIGAGAIILPGQVISAKTMVAALTRYKNEY